jgi:hypothetical protein
MQLIVKAKILKKIKRRVPPGGGTHSLTAIHKLFNYKLSYRFIIGSSDI